MLYSFGQVRAVLIGHGETNRGLIAKDIESTISYWIEERVNHLENNVQFLSQNNKFANELEVIDFLKIFTNRQRYFDTVQVIIPDLYFYVNTNKDNDNRTNPIFVHKQTGINPIETTWFKETKNQMKTTVSVMPIHGFLLERTLNMCTPIKSNDEFKGILCGIIKLDSMFEKIEKLQFLHRSYYFISNEKGEILTFFNNNTLNFENTIQKDELNEVLHKEIEDGHAFESKQFFAKQDVIALKKFKQFNWYIGVGMNKVSYLQKGLKKVTENAVILLLSFCLLVVLTHFTYDILRRKMLNKQIEYEHMLSHRSRIAEVGDLVSGINHQLRQPLNSSMLIVSHIFDLMAKNKLDNETLTKNLNRCKMSLNLMDKTIDIFRNFYHHNEIVREFLIIDCLKGVLHVSHTEFTKNNISVVINEEDIQTLKVVSIENFIQQIILVLIQNSKDAILSQKNPQSKTINIKVTHENNEVFIDISDWGGGVSKDVEATLFSEFKSSKNIKALE